MYNEIYCEAQSIILNCLDDIQVQLGEKSSGKD